MLGEEVAASILILSLHQNFHRILFFPHLLFGKYLGSVGEKILSETFSLRKCLRKSVYFRSDNWQESGKSDALRERDISFILESTPTRLPPPTFPRVLRLP